VLAFGYHVSEHGVLNVSLLNSVEHYFAMEHSKVRLKVAAQRIVPVPVIIAWSSGCIGAVTSFLGIVE
jgi:hypothetical protein